MESTDSLLETYYRQGCVIIRDVLDAAEIDATRAALQPYLDLGMSGRNNFEGESTQRVYSLVGRGRAEEVFEPFRRLHSSSKFEGCGIGPSICRKVIDRRAGRIWFDTDCEIGAHVRFTLGQQKLDAS